MNAQLEQITRYVYDSAGNIVGIESVRNTGAPGVDVASPTTLMAGAGTAVAIDGNNLISLHLAAMAAGIRLAVVESSETQATLFIRPPVDAVDEGLSIALVNGLGDVPLSFSTTPRASDDAPMLRASPDFLYFGPEVPEQPIDLLLVPPTSEATELVVSSSHPALIEPLATSVALPAGTGQVRTTVRARSAGRSLITFRVGDLTTQAFVEARVGASAAVSLNTSLGIALRPDSGAGPTDAIEASRTRLGTYIGAVAEAGSAETAERTRTVYGIYRGADFGAAATASTVVGVERAAPLPPSP